jgi:hypothetical protein
VFRSVTCAPGQLPDGRLFAPVRIGGPEAVLGDAMQVIGPSDPDWCDWVDELNERTLLGDDGVPTTQRSASRSTNQRSARNDLPSSSPVPK